MAKARVFTENEIETVEKLAGLLNQTQLSDFFGISPDTFKRICDRQPEVMRAYKKARAGILAKVAGSLVMDAIDGDSASRMFYLKTQGNWREAKADDNVNINGKVNITHNIVGVLPGVIEPDNG